MATSGTTAFNLDFTEIAEEAWERAGREMRSGYDLRTARRSMNLLTIEWQNRGINMWTIEEGTINLVLGTATYNLPADTIDLLEHVVRTGACSSRFKQRDLEYICAVGEVMKTLEQLNFEAGGHCGSDGNSHVNSPVISQVPGAQRRGIYLPA